MAISVPLNCFRTTWNFELAQSGIVTEVAEFSVATRFRTPVGNAEPPTPFTPTEGQTLTGPFATAAYDAWADNFAASDYPTSLHLASVRCAMNDAAGLTLAESYSAGSGDAWAGSHNGSLPWQLSLCISIYGYAPSLFETDAKSKRGRSYLPPMAVSVIGSSDAGQLADASVIATLNEWDQMWQAIRATSFPTVGGVAYKPVPGIVSPTKHYFTDAAYWRADGVIDTQRRRRNREKGAYELLEVLSS